MKWALGAVLLASTLSAPAAVVVGNFNSTVVWTREGSPNTTSFSGDWTDPDYNGGTATTITFSGPQSGVTTTTPSAPDFSTATDSFFGFESSGFGVGDTTVGRFHRGESFSMSSTHDFELRNLVFREWQGDESLHLSWVSGGVSQSALITLTGLVDTPPTALYTFASPILADANTAIVFTNVTGTPASDNGRLRFVSMEIALVPEPGTALLAGLAVALPLLGRRRRR